MKKNKKPMVFCGVINMDGTPAILTEEEKKEFAKNVGGNQFDAVYCDIPPIITLSTNNKKDGEGN